MRTAGEEGGRKRLRCLPYDGAWHGGCYTSYSHPLLFGDTDRRRRRRRRRCVERMEAGQKKIGATRLGGGIKGRLLRGLVVLYYTGLFTRLPHPPPCYAIWRLPL